MALYYFSCAVVRQTLTVYKYIFIFCIIEERGKARKCAVPDKAANEAEARTLGLSQSLTEQGGSTALARASFY